MSGVSLVVVVLLPSVEDQHTIYIPTLESLIHGPFSMQVVAIASAIFTLNISSCRGESEELFVTTKLVFELSEFLGER